MSNFSLQLLQNHRQVYYLGLMVWEIRTFAHFDKQNDQACGLIIFFCHDNQPKVSLFLS